MPRETGWAGPVEAEKAWEEIGEQFAPFFLAGQTEASDGKIFKAWEVLEKNGYDLPQKIRQQTGDCVAMSTADTLNLKQILDIITGDHNEEYHPIFAPYHYGTGRVIVGKGRLKGGAGSVGSWNALATVKYGLLRADLEGVPEYSGSVSNAWGDAKRHWSQWMDDAAPYTVTATARITEWRQLVDAVSNGFLCTTASGYGYQMKPDRDGFHRRGRGWSHQMGVWGIADNKREAWVAVSNQWGDCHGRVTDETGATWPPGMLRIRREDFERHLRNGECIAYTGINGFEARSDKLAPFYL